MNMPGTFEVVEVRASPSLPFYQTDVGDVMEHARTWREQNEGAVHPEPSRYAFNPFLCVATLHHGTNKDAARLLPSIVA